MHFSEESCVIIMDLHPSRGNGLKFPGRLYDLLCHGFIKKPFGSHTAHDASAADRDIAIFVGQEQGRANSLVTTASRICSVDGCQNRDAEFIELGVSEEGCTVAPSVRIDLFLFRKLHATAVYEPNQRTPQSLGDVRNPEDVFT